MRDMNKRRSPLLACSLLVVVILCLGVLLLAGILAGLPYLATRAFGSPTPALSPSQRIYLSGQLLLQESALITPRDPAGANKPFDITLGESPISIAARLESEGLISDADTFLNYLVYKGLDTTLQAGSYSLSPSLSAVNIAGELQDATPTEVSFRILPGWRIEEIAAGLPTSGLEISPAEFLEATAVPPEGHFLHQVLPPQASLEGFLFPDQYRLPRDLTARQLTNILLNNFTAKVDDNLQKGFQRQGLNLYEAVTLASIVEREAVLDEEMPLIASVFLNRLSTGMKLDSDPTVQYALGFNDKLKTWWTNPLSLQDLKLNSPYNTYQVGGLPPGPIANPGLNALQAVAFPAQSPYYFFRAACDGSGRHAFAETFEGHVQNHCP